MTGDAWEAASGGPRGRRPAAAGGGATNSNERTEAADVAALRLLWEHHWWSVDLIFEAARALGEGEFERWLQLGYGSFHGALAHLVGSEQVWLARVRRGESMARVPGVEELPSLAEIEAAWEICKAGWREVFDAGDLSRTVRYSNTRGEQFADPVWLVLAHLVDHGAAYRGVLIAAFRLLGRTPPTTGLVTYTRQKGRGEG